MPQDYIVIFMSDTHPHLYEFTTTPDGRLSPDGIPEFDSIYRDTCA